MEKTKVFIAYSREDEAYLKRLRKYLAPLERKTIETWYDGKIEAGEVWDEKIKTHLHAADIILLLVSANSLASDYFYNKEMKDALMRHEREEAIVVPVILKYCGWDITELGALQALPKDAKPISAWSDESAAYDSVLRGIYQNVQTIQKRKKQAAPTYTQATRPQPTTPPQKTKITTKTKPVPQNNNNNNFGKILKIALPVLIGIAAIFGIFNWINNRPVSDNTQKDNSTISGNQTNTKNDDSEKISISEISEEPVNNLPNSLPKPIQDLINEMVLVKRGDFNMGSNEREDEKPIHRVHLSSFNIGKYEVTQDQWQAVMGSNPSRFKDCGGRCPVENVTWDDVQEFIKKLNQMTEKTFRLPTEAEWEYAARGRRTKGYKYAGSDDIESIAWYRDNSDKSPHNVGTKNPNELGLYDMSGNVWEWCNDWYDEDYYKTSPRNNPKGLSIGSFRVLRGGSWSRNAHCVSSRHISVPSSRDYSIGFRLAQTP